MGGVNSEPEEFPMSIEVRKGRDSVIREEWEAARKIARERA
jgi:hypothetical protein